MLGGGTGGTVRKHGGSLEAIDETIDVEAEHATTTGDEADMPAETMHGAPWILTCFKSLRL